MSSEFLACCRYNDDGWLCIDASAFSWIWLADFADTNGNISTGLLYILETDESDDVCSSLVVKLRICWLMQFEHDFLPPVVEFSFKQSEYGSLRLDLMCILTPDSTFPLKIFTGIVEYWIGMAATSTLNLETLVSINVLECCFTKSSSF